MRNITDSNQTLTLPNICLLIGILSETESFLNQELSELSPEPVDKYVDSFVDSCLQACYFKCCNALAKK